MDISYEIIRSSRKSLSLQITPAGDVIVRCPRRYPARETERFVESKRPWIEGHLAKIESRETLPALTQTQLRELADRAAKILPERVRYFAPLAGVDFGRITIRSQRTRWGSCSGKGNLNFNCLLLLCPEAVRDYVVVHELCHRKELNHSPKFWAEVEKLCPDYKTHRKWLKENGSSLIGRLP